MPKPKEKTNYAYLFRTPKVNNPLRRLNYNRTLRMITLRKKKIQTER